MVKMLLLIGEYVVAHWWRCCGLLVEMLWLIGGDIVAYWWRCCGSFVEMLWVIGGDVVVADRSRNRVFRECNSFLVPTETVALPGNICGTVYLPGKYGKRVRFSRMLLQRGNVDLERELYDDC